RQGWIYAVGGGAVTIVNETGAVSVIRLAGGSQGVQRAAYNRNNGYVYVTSGQFNTTTVISGTQVVATVPVGSRPANIAYNNGNGYIYVSNSYGNTVSAISGTSVIATIQVGNFPEGIAYDSGNGLTYVANTNSNS